MTRSISSIFIHIKNENINLSFSNNDLQTFSYRIYYVVSIILVFRLDPFISLDFAIPSVNIFI